jgi:hypothetical protein
MRGWRVAEATTTRLAAAATDTQIGIGVCLTAPPLPHHGTTGPYDCGPVDYLACLRSTREGRPSVTKATFGKAIARSGGRAFLGHAAVKLASSMPPPFVSSAAARNLRPESEPTARWSTAIQAMLVTLARGPCSVWLCYPDPSSLIRPHPPRRRFKAHFRRADFGLSGCGVPGFTRLSFT